MIFLVHLKQPDCWDRFWSAWGSFKFGGCWQPFTHVDFKWSITKIMSTLLQFKKICLTQNGKSYFHLNKKIHYFDCSTVRWRIFIFWCLYLMSRPKCISIILDRMKYFENHIWGKECLWPFNFLCYFHIFESTFEL